MNATQLDQLKALVAEHADKVLYAAKDLLQEKGDAVFEILSIERADVPNKNFAPSDNEVGFIELDEETRWKHLKAAFFTVSCEAVDNFKDDMNEALNNVVLDDE